MPRRFAACLLVCLFAGLGAAPALAQLIYAPPRMPAADTGDYSRIHRIAILSAIGGRIPVWNRGSGKDQALDSSGWGLDEQAESTLRRHLKERFTIVDVAIDRAALAQAADSNSRMRKLLAALPAADVDAYMLVRPDGGSGSGTPGLSFKDIDSNNLPPTEAANFVLELRDSHSFSVIASAFSRVQYRDGAQPDFTDRLATASLTLKPGADLPDDTQIPRIRNDFTQLVAVSARETLRALNMGVTLPAPGDRTLLPVPPEKKSFPDIKTIALESALGDILHVNHYGTLFKRDFRSMPIADWKMDAAIEAQVKAALDKRFAVKPVDVDRTVLQGFDLAMKPESLDQPIPGLVSTEAVDVYLVVLKRADGADARDSAGGLVLSNQESFSDTKTSVQVNYALALVDPHSLKPLHVRSGVTSPRQPAPAIVRPLDNGLWPKDSALSPSQAAAVRQALTAGLADSLPVVLQQMDLTGYRIEAFGEAEAGPTKMGD